MTRTASIFLVTCCAMGGVSTSMNRNPPVWLLVVLALAANGLAVAGRGLLRRWPAGRNQTMGDMVSESVLGFKVELAGGRAGLLAHQ